MFVFIAAKFASASIQFKPTVNISEWLTEMLSDAPLVLSNVSISYSVYSVYVLQIASLSFTGSVCQPLRNPVWIGYFNVFATNIAVNC